MRGPITLRRRAECHEKKGPMCELCSGKKAKPAIRCVSRYNLCEEHLMTLALIVTADRASRRGGRPKKRSAA